ncbi:hypothetical protein Back2_13990 [Nocardioides baekrokdamisoli]|uniref:O-antigen polymerase n=1 Tax=Nocardioides baekrokdamisoli TaxID=1804624 RepID=A0A3G9IFJ5_9ACTN|nr:hypothetical protein [Nocardioides baekrokdamisoli]BBH17112.1 hypothetical protein Back2_13990 [Nocardioides baekrokdamisoli]
MTTALLAIPFLLVLVPLLLVLDPRVASAAWLVIFVAVPHWVGLKIGAYLPPVTLAAIIFAPSILRRRIVPARTDAVLAGLFVLATVVFWFGQGSQSMWAEMLLQWLPAYVFGRAMADVPGTDWVARLLCVLFTALALFAVIQYVAGWQPFANLQGPVPAQNQWATVFYRGGAARSSATWGHPIALGGALVAAIPLIWHGKGRIGLRALMTVVVVCGVASTLSRGPILAAGLALVLILFVKADLGAGARVVAGLVTTGLVVGLVPTLLQVSTTSSADIQASTNYRSNIFSSLIPDLHAFGFANNTLVVNGAPYYRGSASIDDTFLYIAANYGWVIAVGVLFVFGPPLVRVARRRASTLDLILIAELPVLGTVALITQFGPLIWFLLGMAVTVRARERAPTVAFDGGGGLAFTS